MVVFNPVKREIDIKIVYYGPALCGKTTNLQSVHLNINPDQRGELVSLATKDDRTLFFDFLPIELDGIKGFKTRFHVYTVPGQVFYTLTRRAVLTGVDGIIFVADSQNGKMEENRESLSDLRENLNYYNKDISSMPFVIQYNKRDLASVLPVEELDNELNEFSVPSFGACAVKGEGVMETLTMCCKMVLKQIKSKSRDKKVFENKEKDKQKVEEVIKELPELTLSSPQDAQEGLSDIISPLPDRGPDGKQEGLGIAGENNTGEELGSEVNSAVKMSIEAECDQGGTLQEGPLHGQAGEETVTGGGEDCTTRLRLEEPSADTVPGRVKEALFEDSPHDQAVAAVPPVEKETAGFAEASKKICPRCSLAFKSNVKKCPVCKYQFESNEEECTEKPPETLNESSAIRFTPPMKEEAPCTSKDAEVTANMEKCLEIVACGQPQRVSPTTISIPLIMKSTETHQEFKVSLSLGLESCIHNHE